MSEQTPSDVKPNNARSMLLFIIVIIAVLALFYYMFVGDEQPLQPVVEVPIEQIQDSKPKPPVKTPPLEKPVETQPIQPAVVTPAEPVADVTLPELDNSDQFVVNYFQQASLKASLFRLLLTDDFVRRIVVFVDNFAKGELAYKHMPLKPLADKFAVREDEQRLLTGDKANWQRYQPYLQLLQSFEPKQLLAAYRQMQPLFEHAYQELGYPEQSFDDALLFAMQRILNAKVATSKEVLVQPNVVYKFAQPSLEKLPEADKLMLRMGRENLLQLKAVVLELERLIEQGN
ncbi:DUF3014 domain-containing protein [Thalassotalea maritima]|uniref:DUF3014 domain-containing protein n=1 Tax=Thalassotalea maritima TaxID=3242416 RepID=UPI0035283DE6